MDDQRQAWMAEYQAAMNLYFHSGNWVWTASSLFLGSAMAGLVLLMSAQNKLGRPEWIGVSILVVVVLVLVKLYLNSEEQRQTIAWKRMSHLETQLGFWLVRAMERQRPPNISIMRAAQWLRWPWFRGAKPYAVSLPKPKGENRGDDICWTQILGNFPDDIGKRIRRYPFGWLFLHSVTWLLIVAWIAAGVFRLVSD